MLFNIISVLIPVKIKMHQAHYLLNLVDKKRYTKNYIDTMDKNIDKLMFGNDEFFKEIASRYSYECAILISLNDHLKIYADEISRDSNMIDIYYAIRIKIKESITSALDGWDIKQKNTNNIIDTIYGNFCGCHKPWTLEADWNELELYEIHGPGRFDYSDDDDDDDNPHWSPINMSYKEFESAMIKRHTNWRHSRVNIIDSLDYFDWYFSSPHDDDKISLYIHFSKNLNSDCSSNILRFL